MPRIGKFTKVLVDDSGATARDISTDVTSMSSNLTYQEVEIGGFTEDMRYLAGRGDASYTLTGRVNTTALTGSHTVLKDIVGPNGGTTITVTIQYGNNAVPVSGDPEFEGEFFCTSYEVTPELDGAQTFTANFKPGSTTLPAWGTVT
jgi:hypothetical protein